LPFLANLAARLPGKAKKRPRLPRKEEKQYLHHALSLSGIRSPSSLVPSILEFTLADAPWAKAAIRVDQIVSSRRAPQIGTVCYNYRVVPLFEHVAHFSLPPRCIRQKEMIYSNKVAHFPGSTISFGAASSLDQGGMVAFRSITAATLAPHLRAAVAGKVNWHRGWSFLCESALDDLPVARTYR
jgi:hypothetical protein